MTTHNAENERLKRRYFIYLKEAKRHSPTSIDGVAAALYRFEVYTRFRDFRAFRIEQAVGFKQRLAEQVNERTDEPLSKATQYATLSALRSFFQWLAGQPGFRSRLRNADADYFSLSQRDTRIAKAVRERPVPTLEQIRFVLQTMPTTSEIERRNRALVAFTLLTGARDSAIASMKLKHVNLADGLVFQDAREVQTKFRKTFTTWFFPVGDDVRMIIAEWIEYLRITKLRGNDDPVFPATRVAIGVSRQFEASGLDRVHWSSANPIRAIFKEAFERAGLPYFNPHSFRKTLARLGEQICRTPEEFKAWSQNLGHERVLTTFASYGEVPPNKQGEIIRALGAPLPSQATALEQIANILRSARSA